MTPFCERCGCIAEDDLELCVQCRESGFEVPETKKREEPVDCAFMCNGSCRSCGQPVVYVNMLPIEDRSELVAMNPELEHGGNIEIRRSQTSGKLFAKETGPDPDERKFIMHSIACIERRKNSKADALMPDAKTASKPNHRKTWQEERAEMIQVAIRNLE